MEELDWFCCDWYVAMELIAWFWGVSMLLCSCYGGGGGRMLL